VKSGFRNWSKQTYSYRASLFFNLINHLTDNRRTINDLIRLETGKTLQNCEAEFDSAIAMLRVIVSYEHFPNGIVLPSRRADRLTFQVRTPLGISLLIFPSNAPLPNFIWKLAPSLMAGNVVLAKPSPYNSKTFDYLLNLMRLSGFGEEVLQRVDGEEEELYELMSLGLDLVSFTGSTRIGSKVAGISSPYMSKLILECGGVNPFIVDSSAELDKAVQVFCDSAFGNSGQRCASASVLFLQKSIRSEFLEKVDEHLSRLTTGVDEEATFGPLCSRQYVDSLHSYVNSLNKPRIIQFTNVLRTNPWVYQPTIIDTGGHSHNLFERELYGPICLLRVIDDIREAIDLANDSKFGLTAAIWSNNRKILGYARENIRYGVLNMNGPTFGSEPNFPFGGMRMSGNGIKEAGYDSIEQYSTSIVISDFSV
jgi:aldehyde dehydrogenase (NAD+)